MVHIIQLALVRRSSLVNILSHPAMYKLKSLLRQIYLALMDLTEGCQTADSSKETDTYWTSKNEPHESTSKKAVTLNKQDID